MSQKTVVLKIVSLFFQEKLNPGKVKVIWKTQIRIFEFSSKVDKILKKNNLNGKSTTPNSTDQIMV